MVDVPITFQERIAGELGMKQNGYRRQPASQHVLKFGLLNLHGARGARSRALYIMQMLARAPVTRRSSVRGLLTERDAQGRIRLCVGDGLLSYITLKSGREKR